MRRREKVKKTLIRVGLTQRVCERDDFPAKGLLQDEDWKKDIIASIMLVDGKNGQIFKFIGVNRS